MNENEAKDQVKLDKGFTIKCNNCGCDKIKFVDNVCTGSSGTGLYGSFYMECPQCKQTETVMDT